MKSSKTTHLILGLLFLSLGIILFGNNFKLWDIRDFFTGWWSLFIIIPMLISLFRCGNILSCSEGILIGVLLFLYSRGIIGMNILIAILIIILVCIVISIIGKYKNRDLVRISKKVKDNEYKAILIGLDKIVDEKFRGCRCISIFGGIDLDLEKAKISDDIVIDCKVIFGSIHIKTPKNIGIKKNGISTLGGISDKSLGKESSKNRPNICIHYLCIFGGINIK